MAAGIHLALRAAMAVAFVFAGVTADAARLRLPREAPVPAFNPVAAEQANAAARRGDAAARKVVRVAKRAGARLIKAAKAEVARLPGNAPIPTANPVKMRTVKAARPSLKRGKAAARQVVAWARRAGKAIERTAKAARVEAAAAQKKGNKVAAAARQAVGTEAAATAAPKNDLSPSAAAKPAKPLTAKQARAAAKRGKAAAKKVVATAARAGKALRRAIAKASADAEAARKKAEALQTAKAKPGESTSTAPLVDEKGPVPMPAEEAACRDRLRAANVKFVEEAPLSDPIGCSAPFPIRLKNLGPDFDITPDAVLNCRMAETVVNFTRDVIAPAAVAEFETRVKTLRHASAYVCRPRSGSAKLSEHAFGNALDIGSFVLEDGSEIAVEATREPERSVFLSRIRTAACGPFKTVLGPGSDADHALHFHFDLAQRRRGGTFCQ